jgi:drug/metabolite transporter (DMT)-like permease
VPLLPQLDIGAVLVLSGVVAYAVYTVVLRRLGDGVDQEDSRTHPDARQQPVVLATATALWGVAFLLPWQAWELLSGTASLPSGTSAVLATAYLGLVASGATLLLWTYGATRVPASVSGMLTAATPALGYAMAVATGEPASAVKTVGGILAISGAMLASHAAVDSRPLTEPSSTRVAR